MTLCDLFSKKDLMHDKRGLHIPKGGEFINQFRHRNGVKRSSEINIRNIGIQSLIKALGPINNTFKQVCHNLSGYVAPSIVLLCLYTYIYAIISFMG